MTWNSLTDQEKYDIGVNGKEIHQKDPLNNQYEYKYVKCAGTRWHYHDEAQSIKHIEGDGAVQVYRWWRFWKKQPEKLELKENQKIKINKGVKHRHLGTNMKIDFMQSESVMRIPVHLTPLFRFHLTLSFRSSDP